MSVLIKGMKMPKNCTECPLNEHEMTFGCAITGRRYNWGMRERLSDCPLVEIPTPHGRLIDASQIVHVTEYDRDNCTNGVDEFKLDDLLFVICEDDIPSVMEGECV